MKRILFIVGLVTISNLCFSQNSKKCSVKLNDVEVMDKVKIEDLSNLSFSCPSFNNEEKIKIRVAYINKDKLVKENFVNSSLTDFKITDLEVKDAKKIILDINTKDDFRLININLEL